MILQLHLHFLSARYLGRMIFPQASLLVRSFSPKRFTCEEFSLPSKKTDGGMAVLDATGDDSVVASFVSLTMCPPRLLNLMPWACFARHAYIFLVFFSCPF